MKRCTMKRVNGKVIVKYGTLTKTFATPSEALHYIDGMTKIRKRIIGGRI